MTIVERRPASASGLCKIDLHIGLPKTGSTSIQAYLGSNREMLIDSMACLFPLSLGSPVHTHLAAACQLGAKPDDLRKVRDLRTREAVDAYRRKLQADFAEELRAAQPERVIISCEHLASRLRRIDELRLLREFLEPFATDVRVWVYLRRQDSLELSNYSTAVVSGRTEPFRWPAPGRERHFLHYDALLEKWASVFGDSRLHVRVYDRRRLVGNDIVTDFCEASGIPRLDSPVAEQNTALDLKLLNFLREFNKRVPRFIDERLNPLRADIHSALASMNSGEDRLTYHAGAPEYYQRYIEGNRRVAARWFPDMDALFEPPERASADVGNAALSHDELMDICAHLWKHAQQRHLRERGV